MDTALPQKFPFILDRNLAKANCTEDRFCTSCDKVVLGFSIKFVLNITWMPICNKENYLVLHIYEHHSDRTGVRVIRALHFAQEGNSISGTFSRREYYSDSLLVKGFLVSS